jgi:hypothetical protein
MRKYHLEMQYDLRPMFLKQQEGQRQAVVRLVYQIQWVPEYTATVRT